MNALAEFKDYYKHLDTMIAESTKADLAEFDLAGVFSAQLGNVN